MKLFGTDGIRGTVGEWPLTPEFCLQLGKVAGKTLAKLDLDGETTVVIGRDTRQSGQMLQSALAAGLLEQGVNVIDLGVIPTPGVSWVLRHMRADAGVVISASHNPVAQNGIKFFNRDGYKLPEAVEAEMESQLLEQPSNGAFEVVEDGKCYGRLSDGRFLHELYIQSLLREHPDLRLDGLTLVVDCANGAAAEIAPQTLSRLGARVIAMNVAPDGVNINRRAGSEHVRRQPQDLFSMIQQYGADFGLAFDGDADRVVFLDEHGELVDGDNVLGMIASFLDESGKLLGRSVVATNMRNSALKSYLDRADITLYETPVGDKYVVEKLIGLRQELAGQGGIGLGGEQSGHIVMIDDEHTTGDGLRTAVFVAHAFLQAKAASFSQYSARLGKVPQVIASAYVGKGPRRERAELDQMEAQALAENPGLLRINLRYSGTEPLFRAMLEADGRLSEADLAQVSAQICRQLQEHAGVGPDAEIDILNCSRGGTLSA